MPFLFLLFAIIGILIFAIGWICFSDTKLRGIGIVIVLVGAIMILSPLIYTFITGQGLKNILVIVISSGVVAAPILRKTFKHCK